MFSALFFIPHCTKHSCSLHSLLFRIALNTLVLCTLRYSVLHKNTHVLCTLFYSALHKNTLFLCTLRNCHVLCTLFYSALHKNTLFLCTLRNWYSALHNILASCTFSYSAMHKKMSFSPLFVTDTQHCTTLPSSCTFQNSRLPALSRTETVQCTCTYWASFLKRKFYPALILSVLFWPGGENPAGTRWPSHRWGHDTPSGQFR